jgi:triacylglycerol lipase
MPLELVAGAKGDVRNAKFLALASDLAYFPQSEGGPAFQSQLGLDAKLISVGNTQCYVGTNKEHIVVAFRGTESPTTIDGLKDWLLNDAVNLLIQPTGPLAADFVAAAVGARWHMGFITAIHAVWEPVFTMVNAEVEKEDRHVWVTGHSLGGALALLGGWLLNRKALSVHQIYTYGAPMVGNDAVAKAIDREFAGKVFRYVNTEDPIPKLPTLSLIANQYLHCQREVGLGAVAAASAASFFQGFVGKAVDGIISGTLIDEVWEGVKARVEAHAMMKYRQNIGE